MIEKPFAPATDRNKQAILRVIREEFRNVASVLEIGSGSGQHAVYFGAELKHLMWQTSDVETNHAGIRAWLSDAALANVCAPLILDVLSNTVPEQSYDGVFSANTTHIMSIKAVEKMFSLVSTVLNGGGVFVLYGPFRQHGVFNTRSNAQFHESLRQADANMGIRHLEELDRMAAAGGMYRERLYALPANNSIAVWMNDRSRNKQ